MKYHQQGQSDAFSGEGHTIKYKIINKQIRLKCTVPCEIIQNPWTFQILPNYNPFLFTGLNFEFPPDVKIIISCYRDSS